jgi:hypothetical protein
VCAALLADEATGRPEWMYADRDEATVVVPLVDATGSGNRVQVAVTQDQAESAPRFGPSRELSQDQEATLYRHYGIDFSTATSDSLLPAEAGPTGTGSTESGPTGAGSTAPEPPAPEPTAPEPTAAGPTRAAPDAAAGRHAASGGADRGRGPAAAVAVLAALAAAVIAAVRLRRGSVRLFRRAAPPPRSAAQRALAGTAAARDRAAQLAATAGPTLEASGRQALLAASAGAEFLSRAASTAVETYTDVAVTRVGPLLATTGRAAAAGTDAVLRATDAATLAVAAAVPRVAEGAVRTGRAGLAAVLALGAAAEALPEVVAETGERLEKSWRRVMGRLSLGLGFGIGYVLGARAGQARYEQIKQAAAGFMGRPEVQQAVEQVRAAAPAPLQSRIDKLSGGGSGRQGTGGGTADVGAVDPVVTPPAATSGMAGTSGGRAPVPDPLVPPAKSDDGPAGRP